MGNWDICVTSDGLTGVPFGNVGSEGRREVTVVLARVAGETGRIEDAVDVWDGIFDCSVGQQVLCRIGHLWVGCLIRGSDVTGTCIPHRDAACSWQRNDP
jgi:hypothetical protein